MKQSKIFMGIGALALAIVGAFAASASHRANTYFYQSATGGCKPVIVDITCATGGVNCVAPAGTGTQPKQLFHTQLTANVCRTTLKPA